MLGCAQESGTPVLHSREEVGTTTVGALTFDGRAPRNVWLVSIDTLRRDHLDPHAADGVIRSPFLSARTAEGVLLADHQQCSNWTLHSMTCTLLGRPVEETGWMPRVDATGTPAPDGQRTLAVRLRELGWSTVLASSNGYFGPEWNSAQGYGPDLADGTDALSVGRDGLEGLRAATRLNPGAPWLLHVHLKEPHAPYDPPEAWRSEAAALPPVPWDLTTTDGMSQMTRAYPGLDPESQALALAHVEALYTAEVRWLDDQLEQLWGEMEDAGLLEDTLVVLWNDHGEAMAEHGRWRHAHLLHREENDGILAFWAKDLWPATWEEPTTAIDLLPTVLGVLGVDPEEVLPGAVVGAAPADRPRFASSAGFDGPTASVTVGDDRLVYHFSGALERYDLAADPGERTNLHAPGDPTSEALWALLEPRVRSIDALVAEVATPPD